MNKLRFLGFIIITIVVSVVVVSCKTTHELCPAYSQGNLPDAEQAQ